MIPAYLHQGHLPYYLQLSFSLGDSLQLFTTVQKDFAWLDLICSRQLINMKAFQRELHGFVEACLHGLRCSLEWMSNNSLKLDLICADPVILDLEVLLGFHKYPRKWKDTRHTSSTTGGKRSVIQTKQMRTWFTLYQGKSWQTLLLCSYWICRELSSSPFR